MWAKRLTILFCAAAVTAFLGSNGAKPGKDPVIAVGAGTGIYYPSPPGTNDRGYYSSYGATDAFGEAIGQGRVEVGPGESELSFSWQNFGSGKSKGNGSPKNEVLERTVVNQGTYYTRTKGPGTVDLIPYNIDGQDDPDLPPFDPAVGPYVAEWVAEFEIVKGTGIFKGARGNIEITATNDPFFLDEAAWTFSWTYAGEIWLTGN